MNDHICPRAITLRLATISMVLLGHLPPIPVVTQASAANANPSLVVWTQVPSPVNTSLNSVAMVTAKNGWAVGENGILLHYDGNSWTPYDNPPVSSTLSSISMSSANNGWAMGGDILLRWKGISWESFTKPSPPWPSWMTDISAPNDSSAWVSGGIIVCLPEAGCNPGYLLGTISHWNGSSWDYASFPYMFISSISMISDTDGWAVGTELNSNQLISSILHWNGSTWTNVPHPIIERPTEGSYGDILRGVFPINTTNAWVSVQGQNILLRWNGVAWTQEFIPLLWAYSVAAVSSDDAWMVGGPGGLAHWDGESWTLVTCPVVANLYSVSMASDHDIWAVGEGGVILHGFAFQLYLPLVSK